MAPMEKHRLYLIELSEHDEQLLIGKGSRRNREDKELRSLNRRKGLRMTQS